MKYTDEDIAKAIRVSWGVAQAAATPEDSRRRWKHTEAQLDGLWLAFFYLDENTQPESQQAQSDVLLLSGVARMLSALSAEQTEKQNG